MRSRTSLYLSLSNLFLDWFNKNYYHVTKVDKNHKDYKDYQEYKDRVTPLRDLLNEFKNSDHFKPIEYSEKRDYTLQRIVAEIEKTEFYEYYVDEHDNGGREKGDRFRHGMKGFASADVDDK